MPGHSNYDDPSPIQVIKGLVTTERSGIGKYGPQSKMGLLMFCQELRRIMSSNFRMAEIGCYAGESTRAFAMIAQEVNAIDPWLNGYDPDDMSSEFLPMDQVEYSFDQRIKGYTNINKFKMSSEEAANFWFPEGTLDFVYIDAIHKLGPCRSDILRWIPIIREGGYIGGHDFCGYWGEVVDAVLETVGVPDFVSRDGSWMKQIT